MMKPTNSSLIFAVRVNLGKYEKLFLNFGLKDVHHDYCVFRF